MPNKRSKVVSTWARALGMRLRDCGMVSGCTDAGCGGWGNELSILVVEQGRFPAGQG